MRDLTEAVNRSSDLADLDITCAEGVDNAVTCPVLATSAHLFTAEARVTAFGELPH